MVSASAREVELLKTEEANGPHPVQTTAPKTESYDWIDKDTGEIHKVPVGIDPGWDYNPGKEGFLK